jgi:serine/threonine-protein kinase
MLMLEENAVVADRFRLIRMIGRGGMGSVWQAFDTRLDTPCAIKFIEGELANVAEAHARFEREAKAAAQLRSPHVVEIKDHGVWQGRPYIAMELLEGEDLGRALQKAGGKLAPGQVASVIQQVCRALSKAHAAGIVHRDLKPDNIFLVTDDDRQIVKILDFGVAKSTSQAIDGSNTKTGAMLGTPYYMSPEQAQGIKTVDSRSDLWSLAVIVFQCITGRLPFESEALGDLLVKIIVHPVPTPSSLGPVPPGFDAWWAKAAERNPDNRYPTAKDFATQLAMALGTSAVNEVGMAHTAIMNTGAAPAFSPGQTAAMVTPQPAMTPPGMVMGTHTPQPHASSGLGNSGSQPATFSGVEPPAIVPKKGPPVAILAAVGGALLLVFAVVGLMVSKKGTAPTAAASTPPPVVASATTEPVTAKTETPPAAASAAPAAAETEEPAPSASASAAPASAAQPTSTSRSGGGSRSGSAAAGKPAAPSASTTAKKPAKLDLGF